MSSLVHFLHRFLKLRMFSVRKADKPQLSHAITDHVTNISSESIESANPKTGQWSLCPR